MILWWLACKPADLAVRIEVRPGIHDLVAVAGGKGPISWRWERNGEPTAHVGDRVPAREIWPGDEWTAIAADDRDRARATVRIPEPPGGNVMVVVIDDVGVEKLAAYGAPGAPPTPTIDALAARGVVFRNAWSAPTCTPTRAELLTGRHPSRHGGGTLIDMVRDDWELPLEAWTVPEVLVEAHGPSWDTSAVGKWHLASFPSASNHLHPTLQGFGWYAGSLGYLVPGRAGTDSDGYFAWPRSHLGAVETSRVYNTTATVDDALDRIAAMPEPFFLYLAFNAPHTPLHVPPAELRTLEVDAASDGPALHAAMLEALDTELGRLFDAMDPGVLADTTVILLADNGTSDLAVAPPLVEGQVKGTLYEGGIHVPLIVAGPHVPAPGVSHALVQAVDVFATVAEIAGVPLEDHGRREQVVLGGEARDIDGTSLLPWMADPSAAGPETVYAEIVYPNGPTDGSYHPQAIRDARYKLVRDGSDRLHALDPIRFDDGPDLLDGDPGADAEDAWLRLSDELDRLKRELVYEGF